MVEQAVALGKKPHIIIATPGRLMDHLTNTKGFTLKKSLKYLVLDEADRILNMDFEKEVNQILANLPREGRRNMLFSATMTKKVAKLQGFNSTQNILAGKHIKILTWCCICDSVEEYLEQKLLPKYSY